MSFEGSQGKETFNDRRDWVKLPWHEGKKVFVVIVQQSLKEFSAG